MFRLFVITCLISAAAGANILVYLGFGAYSHRTPLQPLVDTLADRGHNVTMLSPYITKVPSHPRVNEWTPPKLQQWAAGWNKGADLFGRRKTFVMPSLVWFQYAQLGVEACECLYSDPEFLARLRDPATRFEVIVVDSLVNECAYGLAWHFKAQVVSFNTGNIYVWELESYRGLPDETSFIPDTMLAPPAAMTFIQRATNAVMPLIYKAFREMWFFPKIEDITRRGLGSADLPSFTDIDKNVSLHLVNVYWAQEYARSLPPNVIPVGGIAMAEGAWRQNKTLPRHLEEFIGKGRDGFIFVSFGSMGEFTHFDPEVRQAFIQTAENFPNVQFILKSTYPVEEALPKNLLVEKWLPQRDLLAHPQVRLFITHGGLGGIYEALYNKVPMLCFPLFTDHDHNADLIERKGYGMQMEILTVTAPKLSDAISKMFSDPSYRKQGETIYKFLTERPVNPLELAIWWLEFILRHENAIELLRPLSVGQPWWVRRQLDVWAGLLLLTVALWALLFKIVKLLFKWVPGASGRPRAPTGKKLKLK